MVGGRQREFVKVEALHAAMLVFWKQGYVGASVTDLTSAMGINKPSLYAAFGNKEQLFVAATDYYLATLARPHVAKLQQQGLPMCVRLKDYLMSLAAMISDPATPGGCFISLSANEAAGDTIPDLAKAAITEACNFTETQLQQFFSEEIAQGNVSSNLDAHALTLFALVLLNGNACMARGGKTLQDAEAVFDIALSALSK